MLRLKEERIKRGWTQLELAFKTKIHPPLISQLESGKIYPYPSYKRKLEKIFGIDGDKLFEEIN